MKRKPPADHEYSVVGCSDCDNLQIVQGAPKTTTCRRCGKRLTFKSLKKFYTTEDKQAANNARALKLAARAGNKEQFRQLLESGSLDPDTARAITDAEYLEKLGLNPEIADDDDSPSAVEAVQSAITDSENPTAEQVVENAVDGESLAEDEVRDAIDRLRMRGDIIELPDGSLRLV